MKIIFLSHTSRNSTFKVGSYHLSNEAIKVHGVLYINPPISPFHYLKALLFKKYRTTIFKVKTEKPLIYTEENGIINYTPFKLFPFRKFYGLENIIFAEKSELSWMHRRKLRVLGYDKADLVIQDNLNLTFFKTLINCKKWIYRPTDDILSMPNQSKKYLLIENKVVNFSNQIFVTSTELKKIISDRYHRDCTVLHNGIDIKKLQIYSRKVPPIIKRLSNQRAIIVTYIGSLDQRFDFKLLTFIARMLPEHQFVIGGSSSCYFPDFPNVHEIGNVPYEEVGNYYSNSRAFATCK